MAFSVWMAFFSKVMSRLAAAALKVHQGMGMATQGHPGPWREFHGKTWSLRTIEKWRRHAFVDMTLGPFFLSVHFWTVVDLHEFGSTSPHLPDHYV